MSQQHEHEIAGAIREKEEVAVPCLPAFPQNNNADPTKAETSKPCRQLGLPLGSANAKYRLFPSSNALLKIFLRCETARSTYLVWLILSLWRKGYLCCHSHYISKIPNRQTVRDELRNRLNFTEILTHLDILLFYNVILALLIYTEKHYPSGRN